MFLREWQFLIQNMGMRALTFPWKIRKKGIVLTLMAHNLVYSFDRIDVLLSKYDDDRRGFITKNS